MAMAPEHPLLVPNTSPVSKWRCSAYLSCCKCKISVFSLVASVLTDSDCLPGATGVQVVHSRHLHLIVGAAGLRLGDSRPDDDHHAIGLWHIVGDDESTDQLWLDLLSRCDRHSCCDARSLAVRTAMHW